MLYLRKDLAEYWRNRDAFAEVANLQGELCLEEEQRQCLRFNLQGQAYRLSVQVGPGWRALLAALLRWQRPAPTLFNDWHAATALALLGIDTIRVAGCGTLGWSPARKASFLIEDDLTVTTRSLRALAQQQPLPLSFRRRLIRRVAQILHKLHHNGIVHGAFTLQHLRLSVALCEQLEVDNDTRLPVYVVGLAQVRMTHQLTVTTMLGELATLFQSALVWNLSRMDYWCFLQAYLGGDPRHWYRAHRSALEARIAG